VVYCVEGGRQIETDEDSDLLVIGRSVHSVENLQQRCLRRVSLPVRRLISTDSSRWGRRRVYTSLSRIFETVDRLDTGL